jgi:putative oxidoreductase
MRAAAGGALLVHAAVTFDIGGSPAGMVTPLAEAAVGALLLLGLWTPVVGVLAALAAAWIIVARSGDIAFWLLAATLGIALALLGPGAWSMDARLFGWKRVDIRNGNGHGSAPD